MTVQKLLFGALLLTVNHHHHHHQRTSISLSERDTQDENKVYWCKGPSLQGLYFQQFNSMQFKWRQCNSSRADNKRKTNEKGRKKKKNTSSLMLTGKVMSCCCTVAQLQKHKLSLGEKLKAEKTQNNKKKTGKVSLNPNQKRRKKRKSKRK